MLHRWVTVGMLLAGIANGQENDYCKASYCKLGLQNVGCNPPWFFGGPACTGKSAHAVDLALYAEHTILKHHNQLRSKFASGKLAGFQPASRMATLVWDNELSRQAGHNARSCVVAHDACSNTEHFRYVGQNLAVISFTGTSIPIDQVIRESIQNWWSEHNVTSQVQLNRYPTSRHPIGHFAQMVSDRAWKMGCAIQGWIEPNATHTYYMVCNYSFTNLANQPVYQHGPKASGCRTGENPAYPGLCSINERILSTPSAITD